MPLADGDADAPDGCDLTTPPTLGSGRFSPLLI